MCHFYYRQIIIYQTIFNLQTCFLLNMAGHRASTSNAAFFNVKIKHDRFSGSLPVCKSDSIVLMAAIIILQDLGSSVPCHVDFLGNRHREGLRYIFNPSKCTTSTVFICLEKELAKKGKTSVCC